MKQLPGAQGDALQLRREHTDIFGRKCL